MALTTKIDHLQSDIGLTIRDLDSFKDRITEVEQCVSSTVDRQGDHTVDLHTLKTEVCYLEARVEDADNCNHRNNLSILSLSGVQRAQTLLASLKICWRKCF